jgi:queuine tRNA-ribosyltransferase
VAHKIHWFENGQASISSDIPCLPGGKTGDEVPLSEAMHSFIGPWEEAQQVYLLQSKLSERLSLSGVPLVLFDIGFGIGANALAALDAFELGSRNLHLVSFESDLGGIRTALEQVESFPFLAKKEALVRRLLKDGHCSETGPQGKHLRWELAVGDFRDLVLNFPSPEVVYFDLYSPKVCPQLWGFQTFKLLRQAMAGNETSSLLVTYCAATSVRSAMLLAGFQVGYGTSTAAKKETTLATLSGGNLSRPLDETWFKKRARSSKPFPEDIEEARLLLEQPFATN